MSRNHQLVRKAGLECEELTYRDVKLDRDFLVVRETALSAPRLIASNSYNQ